MENSLQYSVTYDANGNRTNELNQWWNNPTWVNGNQTNYTYDANGNLMSRLYQTWNGAWVNNTQDLYTYQQVTSVTDARQLPTHYTFVPKLSQSF